MSGVVELIYRDGGELVLFAGLCSRCEGSLLWGLS